ncbi:MAG: hypothetical protein LC754_11645 [Acidobacteria bacterium]|nr:hypothetical protein [Acidobacteriota bacterium]
MSDASHEKPGRVPEGMWGGLHVRMQVSEDGAEIEYDCAHGTLDAPLKLDGEGRFAVTGTHVREGHGPIRLGVPPASRPAHYTGRIEGRTMSLTVTLENSTEDLDTFTLREGSAGRLWKCR